MMAAALIACSHHTFKKGETKATAEFCTPINTLSFSLNDERSSHFLRNVSRFILASKSHLIRRGWCIPHRINRQPQGLKKNLKTFT